jgi:hypothetical protein
MNLNVIYGFICYMKGIQKVYSVISIFLCLLDVIFMEMSSVMNSNKFHKI